MKRTMEERFWSLVSRSGGDDCWHWNAYTHPGGYGMMQRSGRGTVDRAHRVSCEIHFGPIPAGFHVLHRCDVRNCVNPKHLFIGTNADNVADKVKKGRTARVRGTRNGLARLSDAQVIGHRCLMDNGSAIKALSRQLSIPRSTLRHIMYRRTWAWL